MKTFTIEEVLDILIAFEMSVLPETYPSTEGLEPGDFMDAAYCKAEELGILNEFIKAGQIYKSIPIDELKNYKKEMLTK